MVFIHQSNRDVGGRSLAPVQKGANITRKWPHLADLPISGTQISQICFTVTPDPTEGERSDESQIDDVQDDLDGPQR